MTTQTQPAQRYARLAHDNVLTISVPRTGEQHYLLTREGPQRYALVRDGARYLVTTGPGGTCTCPAFAHGSGPCKHILALRSLENSGIL